MKKITEENNVSAYPNNSNQETVKINQKGEHYINIL